MAEIKQIKWFTESPDAGLPECICSLCGQIITDIPARIFERDSGQEARFDQACFELVTKRPELPDVYDVYRSPSGLPQVVVMANHIVRRDEPSLPLSWEDEASGELRAAMIAYFSYMVDKNESPPSNHQLAIIIQYCTHYIFAPCWDESGFSRELLQLRYEIQFVLTIGQLARWVLKCLEIALDPL